MPPIHFNLSVIFNWMDGRMDERMEGWMDGQMNDNEWTEERMNEWKGGWIIDG